MTRNRIRTSVRRGAIAATGGVLAAAALAACGGTSSTTAAPASPSATGPIKGQTITVAIAYPSPPKAMLAQFTAQTGVTVKWDYLQFDDLQTKIASAAQAHTYFADIADVDWSKVGEYYATKWFTPLNSYFPPAQIASQYPQLATFERDGQLVAMPMDESLLVTTMNTKDLHAAGVASNPTTLADYQSDLQAIQSKAGVASPLDIPFAAAEGLSTYWYELTAAFGGQILSSSYEPQFTSPGSAGYKAMDFMIQAYKSGLVPKANLTTQDYQAIETDEAHNVTASVFSDYSGDVGTIYDVPAQSSVVGDVEYIPTPGAHGVAPNLGNPDGFGISAQSTHVAAAVAFMKWMEEPANQAAFAGADGPSQVISTFPLPSDVGGLSDLVSSGKVPGAAELTTLVEKHSQPIFPAGAPPWYAQFSDAVYTNINAAAAGSKTVAAAISSISSTVDSLRS